MKNLIKAQSVLNLESWGTKFLLSVLFVVLAFPKIDATYTYGIDPSYCYALNYFFVHHIQFGTDVYFTFGPLAFLELAVPLGHNLAISLVFISLLYITFSYAAILLGQVINSGKWLLHLGVVFLVCRLFFVEDILVGTTAVSLLLYNENKKRRWIALALLASMFSLYIKSSVGISCFFLLISYCAINWYLVRDYKQGLKIITSYVMLYFVFWFCIYWNLHGCLMFLWSTFELVKDYSAAMSIYPDNNWWLLGGGLIIFFLVPFIYKDKKVYMLYALFFLSIFAAWKHGYAREEEVHLSSFYGFLILFFLVYIIYIDKVRILHVFFMALAFMGIYRNMQLTGHYHVDDKVSLNGGINNFSEVFLDYKNFVQKAVNTSAENVKSKKLPDEVLKIIGDKTIDFYPTELTYVAANNLNWKPRPVIQAYTAYNDWLDKEDAKFFASEKSPEFILWEFGADRWGDKNFGEIDYESTLNDEPNALHELLSRYKAVYKNATIILFEKSASENLSQPKAIKTEITTWNKWIEVPATDDGILRAKMICSGNLLRSLKSILFKDEEFYMDCKLTNGNIIEYRIIPADAQNGLWINPVLVTDINKTSVPDYLVDEIRFTCSNVKLMHNEINVEWDLIDVRAQQNIQPKENTYEGKYKNAYTLFMLNEKSTEKLVFESHNDFEGLCENWSYNASSVTDEQFLTGRKSEQMSVEDIYSSTFSIPVSQYLNDSISLMVNASAWVKFSGDAKGTLVIQMDDDKGNFFWQGRQLSDYLHNENEWKQISTEEKIIVGNRKNVKLKVYIINDKSPHLWIDDFDVKLYSLPQK
ncbi:MAG TPA: hypothetical protein VK890_13325 [Bacteroidia bacterium]|nr:hypothetical protein [Bacteroidia bacterium]